MLISLTVVIWGIFTVQTWAAQDYNVYGYTYDEKGLCSGVKIIFSDGATVESSVTYRHTVKGGGVVFVKPEKSGYRFKYRNTDKAANTEEWVPPEGVKVEVQDKPSGWNAVQVTIHFYGYLEKKSYEVSGRVTTLDGKGIPGVSINFSQGIIVPSSLSQVVGNITPAVTDDLGYWGKNGLSDSVTIIALKADWNFEPPYILVGNASSMVNFVGTEKSASVYNNIHSSDYIFEKKDGEVGVQVNGSQLIFDQNPVIRNNKVLVPLQKIFEALGATIKWNEGTKTFTVTKGGTTIKLTIGSVKAYVNGKLVKLDQPPIVVNGCTLVSVKFLIVFPIAG